MAKLKPCPFCGKKVKKMVAPMMKTVMFTCLNCGADVCFYKAEYGEKAVKAWNRRAENENAL